MEIQIQKEIVNVYIRWKEDNLNIQSDKYFLHKIKGIDSNKKFLRSDIVSTGESSDGWCGADLEIDQLYLLNLGYDNSSHIYIMVPENRGQFIMSSERAVDYFIDRLKNGKDVAFQNSLQIGS